VAVGEGAAERGGGVDPLEQAVSATTDARAAAAARAGQVRGRISGYPITTRQEAVNDPPPAATMRT